MKFTKYHGTGNDFIMIDDRSEEFDITDVALISDMCSRRFGIGADGLILLRNEEGYDFKMVYFNSDGRQSSMCGNGGRCLVHFAHTLDVFDNKCTFLAIDGDHEAEIDHKGVVKLKMTDVNDVEEQNGYYIMDTGSPHYVTLADDPMHMDIKSAGSNIRYSDQFKTKGINVNFIKLEENKLIVATYERGVEDETYSCGTGVTACAIAASLMSTEVVSPVSITTKGGELKVYFSNNGVGRFENVWLEGPAVMVFDGNW